MKGINQGFKEERYAYLVERKPEKFLNCVQG